MKKKIIFLDTEFTSLNQNADIISIALVTNCEKKFYAEFNDFDYKKASNFVLNEILPQLKITLKEEVIEEEGNVFIYGVNRENILKHLSNWLSSNFNEIEFWADVPHYDWVFFSELFGGSLKLPNNFNYMCFDLATLLLTKGYDVKKSREEIAFNLGIDLSQNHHKHNALKDAELGLEILKKIIVKY